MIRMSIDQAYDAGRKAVRDILSGIQWTELNDLNGLEHVLLPYRFSRAYWQENWKVFVALGVRHGTGRTGVEAMLIRYED